MDNIYSIGSTQYARHGRFGYQCYSGLAQRIDDNLHRDTTLLLVVYISSSIGSGTRFLHSIHMSFNSSLMAYLIAAL